MVRLWKTSVENFRPGSNLGEVWKLAEYTVYDQIVNYFTKHNLIRPNHHGSLSDHLTATALIQSTDLCLEAAERKELSGVCLIDQSAAYDLLCHQIFEKKFRLYNLDEGSTSWIISYLSNRTQYVQVESKASDPLSCEDHSAPQGSVLGSSVVYVDDDTDDVHSNDPKQLQRTLHS